MVDDSNEFSSFEIEESIIGDQGLHNETTKSLNRRSTFKKVSLSVAHQSYRSPPKDSSESLTSESESEVDEIVLSSDDEESPHNRGNLLINQADSVDLDTGTSSSIDDGETAQTETDSTRNKASEASADSNSSSSSSIDESNYKKVTQSVYDAQVVKITSITERIKQIENLLKLSSQLPDKGQKLRQSLTNLRIELAEEQTILKNLRVEEPSELALDFQNLSINESRNSTDTVAELSYEDDDTIASLFQEIKRSEKTMPSSKDLAEQPKLIKGQLMPHQQHALAWMIWRENQYPKGGILGDDMGLGKTLTTISLIARHIEMGNSTPSSDDGKGKEGKAGESMRRLMSYGMILNWNFSFVAARGGTLVVCPASVVRQWEDEVNKFTNHALSVYVHHGDKRCDNVKELSSHDVVITTYGIVRTEVEKVSALSYERCR